MGRRAFLDVDTQIDFVFPTGALYVSGAERILPAVGKLNRFAKDNGIPVVSTACAHGEEDPEFAQWGPHCVVGTVGQQKPVALLVGQRIFAKQHTDLFQSPQAEQLLAEVDVNEWVVYGVVTEVCVRQAALGLLARGKRVVVVEDAVQEIDAESGAAFWQELKERGGMVMRSADILAGS